PPRPPRSPSTGRGVSLVDATGWPGGRRCCSRRCTIGDDAVTGSPPSDPDAAQAASTPAPPSTDPTRKDRRLTSLTNVSLPVLLVVGGVAGLCQSLTARDELVGVDVPASETRLQ